MQAECNLKSVKNWGQLFDVWVGEASQLCPEKFTLTAEPTSDIETKIQFADMLTPASSGSACTSGSLEPSHVMRAMDIPYTAAHGTIRFSLPRYNTVAEVDRVIAAVPPIVARLRKLSPYWQGDGPIADTEQAFTPAYA